MRSPSADTDVQILAVVLLYDSKDRVFIDYGSGIYRKGFWIRDLDIPQDVRESLIGLHGIPGNDPTGSFFRRGKNRVGKS